jgi:hypothetical protein
MRGSFPHDFRGYTTSGHQISHTLTRIISIVEILPLNPANLEHLDVLNRIGLGHLVGSVMAMPWAIRVSIF